MGCWAKKELHLEPGPLNHAKHSLQILSMTISYYSENRYVPEGLLPRALKLIMTPLLLKLMELFKTQKLDYIKKWNIMFSRTSRFVVPWCSGYQCCTNSFNKAWTQVLRRFNSCTRHVGDSRWRESLAIFPARNKAKWLSSVNHTTKSSIIIIIIIKENHQIMFRRLHFRNLSFLVEETLKKALQKHFLKFSHRKPASQRSKKGFKLHIQALPLHFWVRKYPTHPTLRKICFHTFSLKSKQFHLNSFIYCLSSSKISEKPN